MRKFILYISFIFAINFTFASELNLQFAYVSQYRVILNGVVYNVQGDVINITNINGGYHHLKVMETIPTNYGTLSQRIIYNSSIKIPSRTNVFAGLYNPYNLQINEVVYYGTSINIINYSNNFCSYNNVRYISYNNFNTFHHNNYYYRNRYKNCHTSYGYRNNTINTNGHVHNRHQNRTTNRPRQNTTVRKVNRPRQNTNRTVRTTTRNTNRGTVRTSTRRK